MRMRAFRAGSPNPEKALPTSNPCGGTRPTREPGGKIGSSARAEPIRADRIRRTGRIGRRYIMAVVQETAHMAEKMRHRRGIGGRQAPVARRGTIPSGADDGVAWPFLLERIDDA